MFLALIWLIRYYKYALNTAVVKQKTIVVYIAGAELGNYIIKYGERA